MSITLLFLAAAASIAIGGLFLGLSHAKDGDINPHQAVLAMNLICLPLHPSRYGSLLLGPAGPSEAPFLRL